MAKKQKLIPLLVTTSHRGVFFGYVTKKPTPDVTSLTLTNARLCVAWSADMQGFMGLAAKGPSSSCRIGPRVAAFIVNSITSICVLDSEVAEKWEAQPWR